jgi:hypothetical protein
MLTKAPKTKHEQLVAAAQSAAQSFWWALWSRAQVDDDDIAAEQYRFAKYVCEEFAEYAKITNAVQFSRASEIVLSTWAMAISRPKSHYHHLRVLHRMRRDAKSLRRQLVAFETELQIQFDEINLRLGVALGAKLELGGLGQAKLVEGADWSLKLRETLSRLIEGLDDVTGPGGPGFLEQQLRARGAPSEIDGYPGLAVLVFGLECVAQQAGGKFTVHHKHGEKGTLIRALEELRGRLVTTDWGVSLADCLPSPGKHPITKYERIIRAARDAV